MAETNNGVITNTEVNRLLIQAQSILENRANLAAYMGKAFGGDRDYYETLGYKRLLLAKDFIGKYYRQDIASRIVNAYPDETWRLGVEIYEDNDEQDTEFEQAWLALEKRHRLTHYFHRVDRLAGLGQFAIMVLGIADKTKFESPIRARNNLQLQYLSLYHQDHVRIKSFDNKTNSPRFGLPEIYEVDFSRNVSFSSQRNEPRNAEVNIQKVHYSRVIHVAEGLMEDDVYGTPCLESIYNLLDDLHKLVGGSAEMYWRNASRDLVATIREGAHLDEEQLTAIREDLGEFAHGLRRVLGVEGVDVNSIAPEIESPRDAINAVIDMIAGAKGIPKRILVGSERGELASSMDETNWLARVEQRRTEYAEPVIIRQFIDRMMSFAILPIPADGYRVEWPPLFTADENDKAEQTSKVAMALERIAGAGRVLEEFPLEEVREEVLGWDPVSIYQTEAERAFDEEVDDDDFEEAEDNDNAGDASDGR